LLLFFGSSFSPPFYKNPIIETLIKQFFNIEPKTVQIYTQIITQLIQKLKQTTLTIFSGFGILGNVFKPKSTVNTTIPWLTWKGSGLIE